MPQQQVSGRRRDRGLVWGFIAVILLSPSVTVWLSRTASADAAVFGRPGALVTGFIAIIATVVAAVVSYLPKVSGGIRWGLGLLMAAVAAAVAVLALDTVFSTRYQVEVILDLMLLASAAAMVVVGSEVARRRTPRVGRGARHGELS